MSYEAFLVNQIDIPAEKFEKYQNQLTHSPNIPLQQTSSTITETNNDTFYPRPCHLQVWLPTEIASNLPKFKRQLNQRHVAFEKRNEPNRSKQTNLLKLRKTKRIHKRILIALTAWEL
ncbi:hypothetical protein CDAR_591831 [Caerostris darwini]|uniref:Uncharacterized protein n=1 Tax=Caerostris darwini TaxID=1538125 RepID=A0AAV4WZR8_9ARAC|nr:hypothetical protein CDAR_591831 [Caerostris darwini]